MKTIRIFAIIWMIFILLLTSIPSISTQKGSLLNRILHTVLTTKLLLTPSQILLINDYNNNDLKNFDKIVHLSIYFFLSLLFFKGYGLNKKAIIFLLLFALFDELHQIPIPGREFSLFDWFFDYLGIIFVSNGMRLK